MDKFTAVENLASFLMDNNGSVLSTWKGKMSAKQQRELFGVYLGKGLIVINGTDETIQHLVKVCHWNGQDSDPTFYTTWGNIQDHAAEKENNNGKCN